MGGHQAWRGPRPGATLWRVVSDPGEPRVLPDGVMGRLESVPLLDDGLSWRGPLRRAREAAPL